MREYPKIQTIFERDPETNFKTVIEGKWAKPEFEYLQNNEWVMTEKVDGTNIRVMWNHETKVVAFGGKTDNAQIPGFLTNKLIELFPVSLMERRFQDTSLCLYGEGYGAKIQKGGGNYRKDQSFVLFDILIGDWWLQRKDVAGIAFQLDLELVPLVGNGTLHDLATMVRDGFKSQWGDFTAEGIVARPAVELKDRGGNRVITKLKYKDFPRKAVGEIK